MDRREVVSSLATHGRSVRAERKYLVGRGCARFSRFYLLFGRRVSRTHRNERAGDLRNDRVDGVNM